MEFYELENENNENNEIENKEIVNKEIKIKRENNIYKSFYIAVFILIIINVIFYITLKLSNLRLLVVSIIFTFIIPFIFNAYNTLFHLYFEQSRSVDKNIKELKDELLILKESRIPIILFGLGIFLSIIKKKSVYLMFPYLLVSLFLGTVVPIMLNHFIFDYDDLTRLVTLDLIIYLLIITSYGFLSMSMYLAYIYLMKNLKNIHINYFV